MSNDSSAKLEKRQHRVGEAIMLAAITALLTAATNFATAKGTISEKLTGLVVLVCLPVGILLVVVGLYLRFSKVSRLLKVDALRIEPDNPDHLIGRDEAVKKLEDRCRDAFLVHLVGESGAGKSALVRSGLIPKLKADATLLPVELDAWGQDWEQGPRTALANGIWKSISELEPDQRPIETRPEPDEISRVLQQLGTDLGRTPLLIFDQFDDYQARHRERFIVTERQTVLSTDELLQANSFWKEINDLLQDRKVRCLFVTRADTAAGLESVRFIKPQVFPLDRPEVNIVNQLLTTLTTAGEEESEVVRNPDHGWNRLKGRIERDLAEDGMVLPVRLRVVLQGLSQLKMLTVGAYERAGGCAGLEAGFIESKIKSTVRRAEASDLDDKQVLGLLLSLVDREGLKTKGKTVAELQVG